MEKTLFDDIEFVERLESLMEGYESTDIEFKSAKGGFPGSLWETYSAFANTQGGVIVLGVKEKDGRFMIDNLSEDQIQRYKCDLWNGLNNKSICSTNILKDGDVQDGEYNGSYVLVINVPRAQRTQIPIYIKNNPDNVFKRNHEGDYQCTPDNVRRMYADADVEHTRDSRILPEFTIEEDIDNESLQQYKRIVSAHSPSHPWLSLSDKELLKKLGGYRVDKREKKEGLTIAGLLMFGKIDSITDQYCCPNYFPDYREYFSSDPHARWTNRVYADGTWEANLFQFYLKVYNKLAAALPKPFALSNGIRVEETSAHVALREAFINALVHCDYSINASLVVEQHKDYIKFSNPGSLLITMDQFYHGGESVCRNKYLQQMFTLMGAAEKAGSGADKILLGWKEADYRSPELKERTQPDKVELTLPLVNLLSKDILSFLKNNYGDAFSGLTHDELMTLATCYSEGEVSNYRLQVIIDQHSADITKLLKKLCDNGFLVSYGFGRGTRYQINQDYLHMSHSNNDSNVDSNVDSNNDDSKTQRKVSDKLIKAVIAACEDFSSVEEIAIRVGRSISHLKNRVLPKMFDENLLERQFPDVLKHPHQKYRAKK